MGQFFVRTEAHDVRGLIIVEETCYERQQTLKIKSTGDAVYVVSSLTVHNSFVFLFSNCDRIC